MQLLTILIVPTIVLMCIVYMIYCQRSLVKMGGACKKALSRIDDQLNSRWDLILGLVRLVEKYSQQEHDLLVEIIQLRNDTSSNTAEDVEKKERVMNTMIGRIQAVAELYPELKAAELYARAMDSMAEYEEKVRLIRMVYNDSVTKMNRFVRQFPYSVVAGMFHFTTRDYLKVELSKRDYTTK